MLDVMITAVRPGPVETRTPIGDGLRTNWVAAYRALIPSADRWARGRRELTHGIETQERVFRMAEQLARRGVGRQDLFASLEEADRSVATGVNPEAAANAGYLAIAPLVPLDGAAIVIGGDDGPPDLRAFGFDPIPFDGHDPAAYAWVMFELTARTRADGERWSAQCNCQPSFRPASIGLARL
ncbi:MAG: hypothetical protein QOH92_2714 [Chloroflexota bacterium]|nr:hypothetical protein [Chloroflexota bacterium]